MGASSAEEHRRPHQTSLIGKGRRGGRGGGAGDDDDWVDSVVQVANTCKKLFTQNTCRMCQVYVDEQVEYERREEAIDGDGNKMKWSPSPFQQAWMRSSVLANNPEVELYRQFLFDEESVVEVVMEREKEDDASHDETRGGSSQQS